MMDHYSTSTLIIALVAVTVSIVEGASKLRENLFYSVSMNRKTDGTALAVVIGRHTFEHVKFARGQDTTIYRGDVELAIGDTVFGPSDPSWGNLFVIEAKTCYTLLYGKEETKDEINSKKCGDLKKYIQNLKTYIFPMLPTDNVNGETFKLDTKQTNKFNSYKIVGRGVWDVFTFTKIQQITVFNEGKVLMIGSEVCTYTYGVLFITRSYNCRKREYEQGELIAETKMNEKECQAVWNRCEVAAEAINPVSTGNGGSTSTSTRATSSSWIGTTMGKVRGKTTRLGSRP